MVREIGAIIRNQIPSGRRSMLDAYGEILLRAWRNCVAASLLTTEDLIQVLQLLTIDAWPCTPVLHASDAQGVLVHTVNSSRRLLCFNILI